MKHIKYIALAFIGGLAISCETNFLEPVPEVAVSSAGYFLNDEQIETGVIGIYDAIQGVNSTSLDDNRSYKPHWYSAQKLPQVPREWQAEVLHQSQSLSKQTLKYQ